jgi:CubicO group peptidase (beta-lactamase class C family)
VGQVPELNERTKAAIKSTTSESTSGVAILVVRDGKTLIHAAGGMADIEKKIPITVETVFRIGSVTKQFTAMAVLRLAEEGKLSLQDPLSKYFPDLPNAKKITLEHLLTHTSGLCCLTSAPDFYSRVTTPTTPANVIEYFKTLEPDFEPGFKFKYGNTGYFLLGEIVAKVSGKSFAEYLATTFFQPLGMKNTGIYDNAHPPKNTAVGYMLVNSSYLPALDWDMSWIGGAGAMYSTVTDLHQWNEALYGGKVISQRGLDIATKPYMPKNMEDFNYYGYGLTIGKHRRIPFIYHGGGLNGWSAELAYYPEQKCSVAILTNAMPSDHKLFPELIARRLAERALADVLASIPAPQIDKSINPKIYPNYIGKYDYANAVMEITVKDNRIIATITDKEPVEIIPTGQDAFFCKEFDAEIIFRRNEKGEITAAVHYERGTNLVAPKIVESMVHSEKQLDEFVGSYQYGPTIMTCTRKGTQLYAQITDQPKFPIFAVKPNTFAWRIIEAEVEFVKDAKGKYTIARHSQNGNQFDAPRIIGN